MQTNTEIFWTYIVDGEVYDVDFNTQAEAQASADEGFAEQCQEDSPRNGESFSEEIELIRYSYDDDGERVIHERIDGSVDYEHYHGDYAEHNTHYRGGCL